MSNQNSNANRIVYLDHLRVFATFAVMILHLSSQYWYVADIHSLQWQVLNVYDSVVRWTVPVFVMISGAVFLGRDWKIKTILSKYVLRLVTAFFFWGLVYAMIEPQSLTRVIRDTIAGFGHMWFIPMIIGLYLGIPIFRKITESEQVTRYFLGLSLIFLFLLPQIETLMSDMRLEGALFQEIVPAFYGVLTNVSWGMIGGYICYYIGGFYLSRLKLDQKSRRFVYLLGAAGFLSTILLSAYFSIRRQIPRDSYYESFTVNVLLECLAVFVWFRYHSFSNEKWNRFVHKLAEYSFGAYLVHMLVIAALNAWLGWNTMSFHPVLSVPVLGVLVFGLSFLISGLLNQIPYVKKYIV